MTGLVFLHGWGYGPQTWDSLVAALSPAPVVVLDAGYFGPPRLFLSGDLPGGLPGAVPGIVPVNAADELSKISALTLAVTCTYNFPDSAADGLSTSLPSSLPGTLKGILPVNPDGWIGVGHSLGFARLLALDLPWRGLVSLGGFVRFCQKPGKSGGTPTDLLEAMLTRLDQAPQDVLARFHKRCGHRVDPLPALSADGLERLRADLEHLRDMDQALPKRPVPTLLLHAQDDRIVPPDLAREAQALLPGSRLTLLDTGGHALPMTRPQDCQRLIRELVNDLG